MTNREDQCATQPEKCGFCGRDAGSVRILLTGKIAGAFICDICILLAVHALVDKLGLQ